MMIILFPVGRDMSKSDDVEVGRSVKLLKNGLHDLSSCTKIVACVCWGRVVAFGWQNWRTIPSGDTIDFLSLSRFPIMHFSICVCTFVLYGPSPTIDFGAH